MIDSMFGRGPSPWPATAVVVVLTHPTSNVEATYFTPLTYSYACEFPGAGMGWHLHSTAVWATYDRFWGASKVGEVMISAADHTYNYYASPRTNQGLYRHCRITNSHGNEVYLGQSLPIVDILPLEPNGNDSSPRLPFSWWQGPDDSGCYTLYLQHGWAMRYFIWAPEIAIAADEFGKDLGPYYSYCNTETGGVYWVPTAGQLTIKTKSEARITSTDGQILTSVEDHPELGSTSDHIKKLTVVLLSNNRCDQSALFFFGRMIFQDVATSGGTLTFFSQPDRPRSQQAVTGYGTSTALNGYGVMEWYFNCTYPPGEPFTILLGRTDAAWTYPDPLSWTFANAAP